MVNKVKDGNYVVIQSFMVNELQLKGTELLVYAIIYGFSQDSDNKFTGSLQYICDWTNCTKQGIIKVLKSLVDKQLIAKNEVYQNNIRFVEYYVTKFNGIKQSLTGIKQSLTNNIYNNTNTNNTTNITNKNISNIKTISIDIVGENVVNESSNEDWNSPQVASSTSKNTSSTKINLGKKSLVNTNNENTLKSIVKEPIVRKETQNKISNKELRKQAVANKAIEIAVKELKLTDLEIIQTVKDWFANCYEQKGMSTSDTRFRYALESLQSVIEKFPKETVLKLVKQAILRSHITLEYVIQELNKPKYNNKNDMYKFPGMRDDETVDEYLARKKKEEQENKAYVDSVKEEIRTGKKTGQWV